MKKENEVKNAVKSNNGFTLIELLVVVLIIGILSAIALPMYRKAVERSRVSDALTTMQAVAKSEHAWYLTNNSYTNDFANLDIEINGTINEGALETDFYTYELLDTGILAERNNREYTIYQDYETKQIMCTPGTHFICENLGAFTKEPCEKVGMAWANTNSTCYVNEEERCLGLYADELGEDIWNENQQICGYNNTKAKEINEGMTCNTTTHNGCENSIVNNGGKCKVDSNVWYGCRYSTINAGGKCVANNGAGSCAGVYINGGECTGTDGCVGSTITAGGVCSAYNPKAAYPGGCNSSYIYDGGECSGACNGSLIYEGGVCSGTCGGAKVYAGGVCSGGCGWNSGYGGQVQVYAGGKCISNKTNGCKNANYPTDEETGLNGCCEGDYCGNAPKCNCKNADGSYATSC